MPRKRCKPEEIVAKLREQVTSLPRKSAKPSISAPKAPAQFDAKGDVHGVCYIDRCPAHASAQTEHAGLDCPHDLHRNCPHRHSHSP